MAWKDPYAILGVGRGAPLSEIKRAYRKLAFSAHPDAGDNPDAQRFRELHEAYAALNEMQQRRARRIKVVRAPDHSGYAGMPYMEPRRGPEPLRRRDPDNVIDDFGTVSPSVGEILLGLFYAWFGLTNLIFLGGTAEKVAEISAFRHENGLFGRWVITLCLWLASFCEPPGFNVTLLPLRDAAYRSSIGMQSR